jgi:hypothetical protein
MTASNDHHYVPQWYQRTFLPEGRGEFHVLDKSPATTVHCGDGKIRKIAKPKELFKCGAERLFQIAGLYSIAFTGVPIDEMERLVFGRLDHLGAIASAMFREWPEANGHFFSNNEEIPAKFGHPSERMQDLLEFMNAQKARTPKGIQQIKLALAKRGFLAPSNNRIMNYFQRTRFVNCTVWSEGMWEIFSARTADTKLLLSDDPVTIYNCDCYPASEFCRYPADPHAYWRGSRVIYPLSPDLVLVITHNEHADDPKRTRARTDRRNARANDQSIISYTDVIKQRELTTEQVAQINYVLKSRAARYVASVRLGDLYPERIVGSPRWCDVDQIFHTKYKSSRTKTEIMVRYNDDTILHSNAFGERDTVPGWFVRQQEAAAKDKDAVDGDEGE